MGILRILRTPVYAICEVSRVRCVSMDSMAFCYPRTAGTSHSLGVGIVFDSGIQKLIEENEEGCLVDAKTYKSHLADMERLKGTLDGCYEEYKRDVLELKKEDIYKAASEIVAAEEMFVELYAWVMASLKAPATNWPRKPLTPTEVAYLQSLENPLVTLATQYWFFILEAGNTLKIGNAGEFLDVTRKNWGRKSSSEGEETHAETS